MNSLRTSYFPTIDILRGFAAISVVVFHVIELFEWTAFPLTSPLVWFRVGWMGVDLFFVISGFVIGLAAFSGIDKHGTHDFRGNFCRRRLIRIVPLHYLTMLVFVVFITPTLLFDNFWNNIIVHLFFVHNFSVNLSGSINGSNWSLATEMQFYLMILLIAPWLRVARFWHIFLLLVGIAWLWRFGVTVLVPPDKTLGVMPMFVAATQLPGMLDEFAIGILLARFIRAERGRNVLDYFNSKTRAVAVWLLSVLVLYLTLEVFWPRGDFWSFPLMVIFFRTLLGMTFGVMLFAACAVPPAGILGKILSPFYYLGTISYGIYLWHLPVLLSLKRLTWQSPSEALPWAIGLTILFAAVSWHFFEQPLIQKYARTR
jgi:peptidoglycan/LPS O-acetylase OafA/YrhL